MSELNFQAVTAEEEDRIFDQGQKTLHETKTKFTRGDYVAAGTWPDPCIVVASSAQHVIVLMWNRIDQKWYEQVFKTEHVKKWRS